MPTTNPGDLAKIDFGREDGEIPSHIGPYEIHGVLGRGGMGVVFDSTTPSGERVALKLMRPIGGSRAARRLIARFLREAAILSRLDHPSIVRLVDAGDLNGLMYLAMKRVEGVSLLAVRRSCPLSYEWLTVLGTKLAAALAHMHDAGVIHRDIKPANVLIDATGHPVITDFGISGADNEPQITQQGDLLGSPGFMAPEVTKGDAPSALSDQFALGRLLFELGARGPTDKLPRDVPLVEVLKAGLHMDWNRFPTEEPWPNLERVLRRMVHTNPAARYEDAHSAGRAFEQLKTGHALENADTLMEHVERLNLPFDHAWVVHQDPASPLPLSDDELIADLGRPASKPTGASQLELLPVPMRAPPPLDEFSAEAPTEEHEGPPAELALLGAPDTVEPVADRVQAELNADSEPSTPRASSVSDVDARVAQLEQQIATLKAQLETTVAPAAATGRRRGLAIMLAALMAGAIAGFLLPRGQTTTPAVILIPQPAGARAPPEASYKAGDSTGPDARDISRAGNMLKTAEEHLRNKQFDRAVEHLRRCIELADLPECHRRLASILALSSDPAARTHFEHYLRTAPGAPDAAAIEKALQ